MSVTSKPTMYFKITVPVKPHIRQFILRYHPKEPVRLSLETFIGKILAGHMTKKNVNGDEQYREMTQTITFEFNEKYAMVFGHSINKSQAYQFNCIIDDIMREVLFAQLDIATIYKIQYKTVIDNFQEEYGFDEDEHISYDTLKKDYYRWRKKMGKDTSSSRGFKLTEKDHVSKVIDAQMAAAKTKIISKLYPKKDRSGMKIFNTELSPIKQKM